MHEKHGIEGCEVGRRGFFRRAGTAFAVLALAPSIVLGASAPPLTRGARRIGIIGSGAMGGAVGIRWAQAGHEVFFSSRNPQDLVELVGAAGSRARAGYPQEAAEFGDVILIAVPYGALPQIGRDYAPLMRGKIVIDCGNPRADRDGPMADEAIARGTGIASAEYLPGVRLVRALNALSAVQVEREAHRQGEKIGVPIAADDAEAIEVVSELVVEAGFDPVVVGPLTRAREFDRGTPVYVRGLTAAQLRDALALR
jgi:predicted dinucleotide-binding enzyme